MNTKNTFWIDTLLIVFLIVPSAFLRLATLDQIYFDIDEAFHLAFALKPSLKELFTSLYTVAPQQFPLDYLINFGMVRLTTDLYQLRLLPVLWGTCSIAASYFLGKILWNRAYGWMWAWLMATSIQHVTFSQLLRPYSLIIFLATLFLLTFFKTLDNRRWVGAMTVTGFLFQLAYPFAALFNAAAFVYILTMKMPHRRAILTGISLSLVIPALWFWKVGLTLFTQPVFRYNASSFWKPAHLLEQVVIPFGQNHRQITLIFLALFVFGIVLGMWTKKVRRPCLFGIAIFMVCWAAIYVSMRRAHLFLAVRHFIATLPLFMGIVAIPLAALSAKALAPMRRLSNNAKATIPLVGISFFVLMASFSPLQSYLKYQTSVSNLLLNEMDYLKENLSPHDVIIFGNPNLAATFIYYLDRNEFFRITDIGISNGFNLFKLPSDLTMKSERSVNPIFTLCSIDPKFATINPASYEELRKKTVMDGGRIYMVSNNINYIRELPPFSTALDIGADQIETVFPGIFAVRSKKINVQ